MPRRTTLALALFATACAGPRAAPEATPAPQVEPAPGPRDEKSSASSTLELPDAHAAVASVPPAEPEPQQPVNELHERAKRAIDAGDYATARKLIEDLATSPLLAEARVLLEHERAGEALAVLQRAIALAPGEARVLRLLGEAQLRVGLAPRDIAQIEVALATFLQSGTHAAGLFGASRAANELQRDAEALRFAQDGMRELNAAPEQRAELTGGETPERTLAEAALGAWLSLQDEAPERSVVAATLESALTRCTELAPRDAWAWTHRAELYRALGRTDDERRVLQSAIAARPDDATFFASLASTFAERSEALSTFEALQRELPRSPLPFWFAAELRLDGALASLEPSALPALVVAEREFAASRARGRTTLGDALEKQALARIAMGWCRLADGDEGLAEAAFRSSEQLFGGALRVAAPPRMRSGVDGLAAVAELRVQSDDFGGAAELYDELRRYEPTSAHFARRAGELLRASGERVRAIGIDCVQIGRGKLTDKRRIHELSARVQIDAAVVALSDGGAALRREFERKGEHWQNRARTLFEASYRAWLDAVALAPDDLRTLVECAAVDVYDLGADLERAERLLRKAVEIGAETAAGSGDEALLTAWGDAHQYLGKLLLERRDDPRAARPWFEKSLEIGPFPRTEVRDTYLPKCDRLLQQKR